MTRERKGLAALPGWLLLGLTLLIAAPGCGDDDDTSGGTDGDADTDTDTDADTDTDGDADTDGDTDTDGDSDGDADGDSDGDTDTYEDGTIVCDPDPPTECSEIGSTADEQYEGCCSADISTVYYCEEGILSEPFLCEDVTPGTHCGPFYDDYGSKGMWCVD
jgi:hypothetical protein